MANLPGGAEAPGSRPRSRSGRAGRRARRPGTAAGSAGQAAKRAARSLLAAAGQHRADRRSLYLGRRRPRQDLAYGSVLRHAQRGRQAPPPLSPHDDRGTRRVAAARRRPRPARERRGRYCRTNAGAVFRRVYGQRHRRRDDPRQTAARVFQSGTRPGRDIQRAARRTLPRRFTAGALPAGHRTHQAAHADRPHGRRYRPPPAAAQAGRDLSRCRGGRYRATAGRAVQGVQHRQRPD